MILPVNPLGAYVSALSIGSPTVIVDFDNSATLTPPWTDTFEETLPSLECVRIIPTILIDDPNTSTTSSNPRHEPDVGTFATLNRDGDSPATPLSLYPGSI